MRHRILSAVLCVAVVAIPIAPVEHVHKATDADGHDHVLAHSHTENHHHHVNHLDADHHDDDVSLDDDDSVVLTLDPIFAVSLLYHLPAPMRSQIALLEEPPIAPYARPAEFVERVIHGPPRAPTVLRGPPLPALL